MEESRTLTVTEAAKVLHVGYKTVQAWTRGGLLPASKIGRQWLIREDDLYKFIDERQNKPKPQKEKNIISKDYLERSMRQEILELLSAPDEKTRWAAHKRMARLERLAAETFGFDYMDELGRLKLDFLKRKREQLEAAATADTNKQ